MNRRRFTTASIALALTLGFSLTSVQAAQWPERPVTLIVPFAPGGATDIVGRIVADQLGKILKQTFIVENRGGAAGAVGMNELARSKPDGYTFALITDSIPIQPILKESLQWKMTDFAPVAKIATSPEVLVVNPKVPASSVRELVELAKSKPGELSYAASSTGSVHHLAGELFKQQTGIDMQHIPYKGGGQSIVDMVSGRVDVGFIGLAPVLSQLRSGQLLALAQTGETRNSQAPDVPTFSEAGYGDFNVELWIGLVGLKDIAPEITKRLQQAITQFLSDEEVQRNLTEIGFKPVTEDPTPFGRWMIQQQQGWAEVVKKLDLPKD
ncbi:tripartite tricarboxylate transporter substrate binding protein [Pusillimonas sp. ANT_WB101]|uniref:Bug family tripartite tricarboxylate transporter substrate binding protein n=1 Tax=Pusillimonas sp. ANT_WB101 TaxID=2597356 RepID=UPI0011EED086|nr:tripartite tricarboxylate transporter substrate binding protein [Pusillimonas sp. ANT_WB101]KAA0890921.1 tripartite tricarboxylate transporter substrate binding protein [Pusillimonas sp. ANT_WB101]